MKTFKATMMGLLVSILMISCPLMAKAQDAADSTKIQILKDAAQALATAGHQSLADSLSRYSEDIKSGAPEDKAQIDEHAKLLTDSAEILKESDKDLYQSVLVLSFFEKAKGVVKKSKDSTDPDSTK